MRCCVEVLRCCLCVDCGLCCVVMLVLIHCICGLCVLGLWLLARRCVVMVRVGVCVVVCGGWLM